MGLMANPILFEGLLGLKGVGGGPGEGGEACCSRTAGMGGSIRACCRARRDLDAQLLGYECQRCLAVAGEVDVLLAAGDAAGDAHALAVGLEVVEV